jgi:cytochrome bd-type quinol oxidase subunit 2
LADLGGSSAPASTGQGFGRVLVAIYGLFALAATSRSAVQLTTRFDEAPLAYLLSAFAAVVYIVATISLGRGDVTSRRVATVAISVELLGVLVVGTASELFPDAFPAATVWTGFGSGYGFVPLALPFVGLWWLRHTRPRQV